MSSRKFQLTLLFAAIVVGNAWFFKHTPLDWQTLIALGSVFGVYFGANAYESASNSPTIRKEEYVGTSTNVNSMAPFGGYTATSLGTSEYGVGGTDSE